MPAFIIWVERSIAAAQAFDSRASSQNLFSLTLWNFCSFSSNQLFCVRPRCLLSLLQRSPQASLENILIIIKGTRFEMMKNVPAEKKLINASVMMEEVFLFSWKQQPAWISFNL
jgi:hypothetical protein